MIISSVMISSNDVGHCWHVLAKAQAQTTHHTPKYAPPRSLTLFPFSRG